jgi:RsiW-degrading membrane proteinase PrsW (M82 family)
MAERRSPATGVERAQRALAAMAATVIGLTAIAIVVLLICRAANVPQSAFTSGPLQLLAVLPLPGLAIGLVLLLAVVVVSVVSRTRSQRP